MSAAALGAFWVRPPAVGMKTTPAAHEGRGSGGAGAGPGWLSNKACDAPTESYPIPSIQARRCSRGKRAPLSRHAQSQQAGNAKQPAILACGNFVGGVGGDKEGVQAAVRPQLRVAVPCLCTARGRGGGGGLPGWCHSLERSGGGGGVRSKKSMAGQSSHCALPQHAYVAPP